jgi:hypothetical protein
MRAVFHTATALALLVGTAQPVSAQTTAWKDHVRVSINFGVQPSSATFSASTTKPVYLETSTMTTTYDVSSGTVFDGGVLVRVAGSFGVGVAVSSFNKSQTASVTGTIPHPFFFGTPRAISGATAALERSEVGVHIQAAYVISTRHVSVAIAGGPTFFNVSQDLVADVTYSDTYPYDTATFTSATVAKVSATKAGFNAGVDVGVKLSKNVGVGGLIRFSRASMNFPLPNTAAGVSADVGGLQAGGGIRFFF